jgi:prepilin-type N-terminal cleavage/methylation domain-containing protein
LDILNKNDGFSLIETLVVILLLGLLVTFTASFFNDLFDKPGLFLKYQALNLANQEMNNCLYNKITTDTSYTISKHNLTVIRKVTEELNGYDISVSVGITDNQNNNIISLTAFERI